MPEVGRFEMPYTPAISVNQAYRSGKNGRKFLHPDAKRWKEQLAQAVGTWAINNRIELHPHVKIVINYFFPRGSGRRPDPDNFIKVIQDGVAKGLKQDDADYRPAIGEILRDQEPPGRFIIEVQI